MRQGVSPGPADAGDAAGIGISHASCRTHPALAGALIDEGTAELTVLAGFDQALVADATRAPPTASVPCSPASVPLLYRPGTLGGFTPGTGL